MAREMIWNIDPAVLEAAAQAMLAHEQRNLARLHSERGTIRYWQEFAQVALSGGLTNAVSGSCQ